MAFGEGHWTFTSIHPVNTETKNKKRINLVPSLIHVHAIIMANLLRVHENYLAKCQYCLAWTTVHAFSLRNKTQKYFSGRQRFSCREQVVGN